MYQHKNVALFGFLTTLLAISSTSTIVYAVRTAKPLIAAISCKPITRLDPLEIFGTTIRGSTSKKNVTLRGINWFGFNNGQTTVDGLWAGGTSFATDFYTIVYKLRLLGFNSVRLPFTFSDFDVKPLKKVIPCIALTTKEVMRSCISPREDTSSFAAWSSPPCPSDNMFTTPPAKICNMQIVNTTTFDRFAQTVEAFLRQGLYVVIDYHPMGSEDHAYNTIKFSTAWSSLWSKMIRQVPDAQGRVIIDIMNEPDSMHRVWSKSNPTYTQLALATMDAIHSYDKKTLFMVEGTGQVGMGLNWGDGFVTDQSTIKKYQIDDASSFFDVLIQEKPYKNNVIISPHLYGPTISKNHVSSYGDKLFARMNTSFGYLSTRGYCVNKGMLCHKFPIVIGEFGSFFKDIEDITFYNDVARYIKTVLGNCVGWLYWAYNANSGDTGGIVTDDWQGLDWRKLGWLQKNMDLRPWYKQA